ncbi:MAG: preprotein translocase subunit SecB [Lachnospiraceae bacterium]|nr:preprotein translocase subunit SecB [Lachnospiraceae bacterium]
MEIKSEYTSSLVLEKVEIIESAFRKKDFPLEDLELGLKVGHEIREIENGRYEILLNTTVSDENEVIYVYVESRALFHIEGADKLSFEQNMIAIVFPYIRSYITSITTQPGMSPIVLPAMNIAAMVRNCT